MSSGTLSPGEPLVKRFARRLISVPLWWGLGVLVIGTAPVVVPLVAAIDRISGRPLVLARCALFFAFYLACELVGMVVALALWLAKPLLTAERYVDANFRLEGWWGNLLFRGGAALFSWSVEVEGEQVLERGGPVLFLLRHASTADSVITASFLNWRHGLRIRHVLKAELLWDPCLDIVGQRIPNAFVRRGVGETSAAVAEIQALGRDLGPRDGVMIYPEGTRFTEDKRRRVLAKLAESEDTTFLERARELAHVLPPRLPGTLGLLEASPGTDVVFCTHTGFEGARSFAEFLGGALVRSRVRIRFERVAHADIPTDRCGRIDWLYDRWTRIDRTIEAWSAEEPGARRPEEIPLQTKSPESLPYRPCVGVMLLDRAGRVFIGRRIDTVPEAWQMPQGGIDEGEDPRAAALRELAEEVGTHDVEIVGETEGWLTYDLPPEVVGVALGGRYRGQRQKWFAMRHLGGDHAIDLETSTPEFDAWRWIPIDELPSTIVAFKRPVYEQVVEQFRHLAVPG